MDLVSLVRILFRRWYILVPMLGITVGCAVALSSSIKPDYEANAVILLIGTGNPTADRAENPLEDLRPLNITAQALAIIMSDDSVRQNLIDQGFAANYQVSVRPDTPILAISARTGDRAAAIASRDTLVDLLRTSLEDQQRNIDAPASSFITAQTISASPGARPINAARDRTLLGVLALGLAASIAAVVAADQFLTHRTPSDRPKRQRRRKRRKDAEAAAAAAPAEVGQDPTPSDLPTPRDTTEFGPPLEAISFDDPLENDLGWTIDPVTAPLGGETAGPSMPASDGPTTRSDP